MSASENPLTANFAALYAVCGMLPPTRGAKTVDAAGVDHMAAATACAGDEHLAERAGHEVDAVPADVERAFPFLAAVLDEAAATADARVVEKQVDVLGLERIADVVPEGGDLVLECHVAKGARDPGALPRLLTRQLDSLGEVLLDDVAGRHVATLGDELPHQRAAHAGAAAGHDRDLAAEILHR